MAVIYSIPIVTAKDIGGGFNNGVFIFFTILKEDPVNIAHDL